MDDRSPQQLPRRDTRKTEKAADELIAAIVNQFKLSSQMSAIDINLLSAMNNSVETFHAALQERVATLLTSARNAQEYANATQPIADDMSALLKKVQRLEALIDRLDEYTARQEAALLRRSST